VPAILKSAVGTSERAFGLLVPLVILALICCTGCTTAASRCTWAFARDGAIPGSDWWKKVDKRLDVPLNAYVLSMCVQVAVGLIYFGSAAAFNAFSGAGVIFLAVSNRVPIAVSFFGGRTHVKQGNFNLG
jgi:amino acid transporter